MEIIAIGAFVVLALVGAITLLKLIGERRLQRYQRNLAALMALLFFIVVLDELLASSWIGCLAIPVFFFGGWYVFYDAFLKQRDD